jgi:signal transduction histidine kinase
VGNSWAIEASEPDRHLDLSTVDPPPTFSRLSSYLSKAPIRDVSIIAAAATALLALVDFATGYEISFSIFYLVPVAFATWYGNRQLGLFFASICAAAWVGVDFLGNHPYSHPAIPLWNGVVRLGFFGIVTLLLDARRRTEDELREAKLVAEAASRAKNAFLAGVSHELRTPLNAIIGYAALLVEEGDPGGQSAKDAVKIERASRHLLNLINNVLDFRRSRRVGWNCSSRISTHPTCSTMSG